MKLPERVWVAPIEDKMRETKHKWFGHIRRRGINASVRRCEMIDIPDCKRGRGRPKKNWNEVSREDKRICAYRRHS